MTSNNFYKNKMAEEIDKRIKSSEWNSMIADSVLKRRKKTSKKIFFTASISSLAAAAAVVLVLSGVLSNKNNGLIYDEFITAQIKGTYDSALPAKNKIVSKKIQLKEKKAESIEKSSSKISEDIIFTEDVDSLISETLALR